MTEAHDPVMLEERKDPSKILLCNEIVAFRTIGEPRPYPVPAARLASCRDEIVARDRDLRAFCGRLLGWRADLVDDTVDHLLTSVARGAPIALRGASDMAPVAHALHRRILGPEHPFVICDRGRRVGAGSSRAPANHPTAMLALQAAMNGSLCLRSHRLPVDFDGLLEYMRDGFPRVTIFVCLRGGEDRLWDFLCHSLVIPPLAMRASESERLIQETFDEATSVLGTPQIRIPYRLRQAISENVVSFAELEKTALCIAAIASASNLHIAAKRLQVAQVSLTRWLERRSWLSLHDLRKLPSS